MRLLTFSSLYPDRCRPRHGIFVETRLRQLVARSGFEAVVVSPLPWFPSNKPVFGEYAVFAQVPAREVRHGLSILHPRYVVIPMFGMTLAPWLMAVALLPVLKRVLREGYNFDLIDAHYFYPDGVAAVLLGKWLDKPVIVTARGTDINLISHYRLPRRMIQWAARQSAAVVTVSQALKCALLRLGVNGAHVTVLRNGIDLNTFQPVERAAARQRLGVSGPMLLSVGNLVDGKGHHIAIEALEHLAEYQLLIVGDGSMTGKLRALATDRGVAPRTRFEPTVAQEALKYYYSAADALVLASSREGMPNVVLEALACGTPVVATAVGGVPEVLAATEAGVLMTDRSARALAASVRYLETHYPERTVTRRYAERFDWEQTSVGQLELMKCVTAAHSLRLA